MLLGEWKLEEAMKYKEQKGREEGERIGIEKGERIGEVKKQHEMIRKFSQINTPEQIAETLQLSLEYVLTVLSGASVVSEPEVPYNAERKA